MTKAMTHDAMIEIGVRGVAPYLYQPGLQGNPAVEAAKEAERERLRKALLAIGLHAVLDAQAGE